MEHFQLASPESTTRFNTSRRRRSITVSADFASCVAGAEIVVKVREPSPEEIAAIPEGALLLGLLGRGEDAAQLERYRSRRLGVFSLTAVPRISRAQKMDALSSMAACAGYKAVLLAANTLGKFFPLLMTAAGTVAPSRVLVLGAGVAGLQSIAMDNYRTPGLWRRIAEVNGIQDLARLRPGTTIYLPNPDELTAGARR